MATLAILRLSRGAALSKAFGKHVMTRSAPALGLTPSKSFTVSPISRKRYLGPQEADEKVDELHHWKNERYVAIALLPLIPAAIMFPSIPLDMALCTGMVLHSHWRLSGVVQDYIHGDILPIIGKYAVLLLSISAFGSLCYFNYYDIGFANAARLIYSSL